MVSSLSVWLLPLLRSQQKVSLLMQDDFVERVVPPLYHICLKLHHVEFDLFYLYWVFSFQTCKSL